MGVKRHDVERKMLVARLDDPGLLGDMAKQMAEDLLRHEHRGPGDTIPGAAQRLQTRYGLDARILLQCWSREPGEMKVSRWMALWTVYHEVFDGAEPAYIGKRAEAVSLGVHPALVRLADLVAGRRSRAPREAQKVSRV